MSNVVIELLKFKVEPQFQEEYLRQDAAIWTRALAQCPGFLGKEVWLNPKEPTEVIIVIRWATKQQWKSLPLELLHKIEQEFTQQLGCTYEIVESCEYQVRI